MILIRYPTEAEKDYLCTLTKLTRTQLNQWFINGRRRILHTTHIKREYMKVKEEEEDIARAPTKKRTTTKMKYEPVEVKPEQSPPAGYIYHFFYSFSFPFLYLFIITFY